MPSISSESFNATVGDIGRKDPVYDRHNFQVDDQHLDTHTRGTACPSPAGRKDALEI